MENLVKNYLETDDINAFLTKSEIEYLITLAKLQDGYEHNKGYQWERIKHNKREKAFFEQWLKENEPRSSINHGFCILQDLFIDSDGIGAFRSKKCIELITNRDRLIVATVIQWLGSNCGMGFLHEALKRCNKTIIDIK